MASRKRKDMVENEENISETSIKKTKPTITQDGVQREMIEENVTAKTNPSISLLAGVHKTPSVMPVMSRLSPVYSPKRKKPIFILLTGFRQTGKDTFEKEIRLKEKKCISSYHLYGIFPRGLPKTKRCFNFQSLRRMWKRYQNKPQLEDLSDIAQIKRIENMKDDREIEKLKQISNRAVQVLTGEFSHQRIALADALKDLVHQEMNMPDIPADHFEKTKDTTPVIFKGESKTMREWYKYFGALERKKDPQCFVKQALRQWDGTSHVIITDWRLRNEYSSLIELLDNRAIVRSVRIYRENVPHPSTKDMYEWDLIATPTHYVLTELCAPKLKQALPNNYPFIIQATMTHIHCFQQKHSQESISDVSSKVVEKNIENCK